MRLYDAIGKRILELCEVNGLTVYSLANKCGISSSNIKNIIYGKSTNPGVKVILHICNGLEMSLSAFFNSPLFENYKNFEDLL